MSKTDMCIGLYSDQGIVANTGINCKFLMLRMTKLLSSGNTTLETDLINMPRLAEVELELYPDAQTAFSNYSAQGTKSLMVTYSIADFGTDVDTYEYVFDAILSNEQLVGFSKVMLSSILQ